MAAVSKANRNRQSAREKIAQQRAEQARRTKRRNLGLLAGGAVLVIALAVGIPLALGSPSKPSGTPQPTTPVLHLAPLRTLGTLKPAPAPGPASFEGVPVPGGPALAGLGAAATGAKVDGIQCNSNEQSLFHIHAHLTIFVNGSSRQVPAGIGIPGAQFQNTPQGPAVGGGTCFYWLHTHAPDGIIHIESPVHRTYTLGDLFDEWGLPLGPDRLGPQSGRVVAIYNGKAYLGNPRDMPLNAHAQIQLEVGTPLIAPEQIGFPNGM
jgi:hypothetical protein